MCYTLVNKSANLLSGFNQYAYLGAPALAQNCPCTIKMAVDQKGFDGMISRGTKICLHVSLPPTIVPRAYNESFIRIPGLRKFKHFPIQEGYSHIIYGVQDCHPIQSLISRLRADGIEFKTIEPGGAKSDDALKRMAHAKILVLTGEPFTNLGWWGAMICSGKVYYPSVAGTADYGLPEHWEAYTCTRTSTKYFDKIYYINLERRSDRRELMEKQLAKFGLEATRIVAVDGKVIKWNQQQHGVVSKFWNPGAMGYCLSYRYVIVDALKRGYTKILVLDDDAVFTDNFFEVLSKSWDSLPSVWHALYLGANHGYPTPHAMPTEADCISGSLYKLKGSMGSHAIILNHHAFKPLLHHLAQPYVPLDMYLAMYQKFFPCYVTYPGICYQRAGHSDIVGEEINYTEDWGVDYINHIAYRREAATS